MAKMIMASNINDIRNKTIKSIFSVSRCFGGLV